MYVYQEDDAESDKQCARLHEVYDLATAKGGKVEKQPITEKVFKTIRWITCTVAKHHVQQKWRYRRIKKQEQILPRTESLDGAVEKLVLFSPRTHLLYQSLYTELGGNPDERRV